jgi:hypothetical protein
MYVCCHFRCLRTQWYAQKVPVDQIRVVGTFNSGVGADYRYIIRLGSTDISTFSTPSQRTYCVCFRVPDFADERALFGHLFWSGACSYISIKIVL